MDLGYGQKNQDIGNYLTKGIIETSKVQEEAVNDEISKYDALLNANDSELDLIRERRIAQMKKVQEQRQKWIAMGHGRYSPIGEGQHGGDAAKEFFDASKESQRLVVHFHRPSTKSCDIFHSHLEKLAQKHLETRFVKIDVDKIGEDGANGSGAAYLVEKLGIVVMPTIVIIKSRKAVHHIRGFDELGGTEDFSTKALKWLLGVYGGINQPEGAEAPEELQPGRKGVNGVKIRSRYSGGKRGGVREEEHEYDSDE